MTFNSRPENRRIQKLKIGIIRCPFQKDKSILTDETKEQKIKENSFFLLPSAILL